MEQQHPELKSAAPSARREGASAGQVALLMLLSAAFAAVAVIGLLVLGNGRYKLVDSARLKDQALISALLENIGRYYYFQDELPGEEKLIDDAAHAIVKGVGDPYGEYYSAQEYDDFRGALNGNYKGVGIAISIDGDNGALVQRVYEDNPADRAGVKYGDHIIKVNGESVIGLDANAVSDRIGGEDGTTVTLTVVRGGETLDIDVVRGDVYVRRIYTEEPVNGIGYIRIDSFTGNAAQEFDEALASQLGAGITSLIIDVRDDPGGSLDVVVAIADRVLGECVITTLQGKMVDPPVVYRSTAEKSLGIPFCVLTNGYSASASEIFASAVQDNGAGKVIGTNTFGKGIVQTSWEVLPGKGFIKLTTDVYLTPNGHMIHGVGVAPDIAVEQDPELEYYDIYTIRRDFADKDLQYRAAAEYLAADN